MIVQVYEDAVLRRSCFEMNETLTHEAALADNLWLTTGNFATSRAVARTRKYNFLPERSPDV